jgi:hypothetical protein
MPTVNLSEQSTCVQDLFRDSAFDIRPPQRRYKWKAEQIAQFWDDIHNAYKQGTSWYFLGSLLLQPDLNSGSVSVIDGQQRLTTTMLLLAVLRDGCAQFGANRRRFDAIFDCIRQRDNDGNPVGRLTLQLQDPDDRVLQIMAGSETSTDLPRPPESGTTDRLFAAVSTLKEKLRLFMIEHGGSVTKFSNFTEFVLRSVKLLPLEVTDESQGYLIFDTTNTRGLSLAPSEQLKARIAVVVREDENRASTLIAGWNRVAVALESAELPVDAMDDYLVVLWSSRTGLKVSKRQLVNRITEAINEGRLTPENLVDDMESYVGDYISVGNPNGRTKSDEDLRDLSRLSFTQAHGFLTMSHHHDSGAGFKKALNAAITLQVRNITIGSHRANEYELLWPAWANLVKSGRLTAALAQINRSLDSNTAFQRNFRQAEVRSNGAATHILRKLEESQYPRSGVQLIDIDLDHVLPRSVATKLVNNTRLTQNVRDWIEDLGFDIPASSSESENLGRKIEGFTYLIGNLAILDKSLNRGQRDAAFSAKRPNLRLMGVNLTKAISQKSRWTEKEIAARQKSMAKMAVSTWTISE